MRTVLFEKEKKKISKKDLINSFIKMLETSPIEKISTGRMDELAEGYVQLNVEYGVNVYSLIVANTNIWENRNQGEILDENAPVAEGGETPERIQLEGRTVPVFPKIYKYKILLGDMKNPNFSSDLTIEEFVKLKIMSNDRIKSHYNRLHNEKFLREQDFIRFSHTI